MQGKSLRARNWTCLLWILSDRSCRWVFHYFWCYCHDSNFSCEVPIVWDSPCPFQSCAWDTYECVSGLRSCYDFPLSSLLGISISGVFEVCLGLIKNARIDCGPIGLLLSGILSAWNGLRLPSHNTVKQCVVCQWKVGVQIDCTRQAVLPQHLWF